MKKLLLHNKITPNKTVMIDKKNFVFFFMLVLMIPVLGTSQETTNNQIEISTGITFQGTGDLFSQSIGAQYFYMFNKNIGLNSMLMFSESASSNKSGDFDLLNSKSLDLGMRIIPFPVKVEWLSLNINLSLRKVDYVSGDSFILVEDDNNWETFGLSSNRPELIDDRTVGVSSAINIRLFKTEKLSLGLRGILQGPYTNGDIASSLLVFAGCNF